MTDEQAQQVASAIASRFDVFDCDACAREIAMALGKSSLATFEVLRPADGSDVIGLLESAEQVSTNGLHVGVAIAGKVFDNLHPHGVPQAEWAQRFVSIVPEPLVQWSKPIGDFFGKSFLVKKFNRWLARSQHDTL